MSEVITPKQRKLLDKLKQRKLLDKLNKMSNMISNQVWLAENSDNSVDECIDMAIWLAKHCTEEIEKIKATE